MNIDELTIGEAKQLAAIRASGEDKPPQAAKDTTGKPRLDLIPPELIFAVGEVLTDGCREQYEPRNWEKGTEWSKYFAAQQRHMWAWWGGENNDPKSGLPHLWHAACCTAFLIAYAERGIGTDDRPR